MDQIPAEYVARYGFNLRQVLILAVCALFTAVAALPGVDMEPPVRVLTFALFGVGGLLMLYNAASRKVALRVDAAGILLGGPPVRYRSGSVLVPWAEIAEVVLFTQVVHGGHSRHRFRYVGVRRTGAAQAPPAGSVRRAAEAVSAALLSHVPAEVVRNSRAASGWKLDEQALRAAIAYHGPTVPVVDLG
ncbi:hypothetical protein QEZ54_15865 [Catellatospora sp. KI3]|uniref:hypothetical protein n=1 Tax=Catellatospora sp. KI3 TaxID=3041620 RepID=UPI0024825412|nr:hypothetical protein [Catellatospora sp. KI3]MDI1462448.1 hypothetical protein [Catellatospora sp. KI3]